jgi:cytochrome c oxidase subunit 2
LVFPVDASAHGHLIDDLFMLATKLTGFAFIAVVGTMVWFLVVYRDREGHKALYTRGDGAKPLGLTLLLSAIVFFGIDVNLAWQDHHVFQEMFGKAPAEGTYLKVRVSAEQFLWTFSYAGRDQVFDTPDDVFLNGEMHVPAGKPVVFEIQSRDVLHSFFVPSLRVKQDAVPGMTTYLFSHPTLPGRYEVACAELCGFGHYAMKARLVIDEPAAFDAWITVQEEQFAGGTP